MKIEKSVEENEYAIYTVELEPGLYVDVKAFRIGSKLIYVMQNEDGTFVYEGEGGVRSSAKPTCFYNAEVEKTIINLVALKEQEACASDAFENDAGDFASASQSDEQSCPFCKYLADEIARHAEWENSPRYKPGYVERYTAACISTTYYEGQVTCRSTSHGYNLNFCPECGKPIAMAVLGRKEDNNSKTSFIRENQGEGNRLKELEMLYDSVAPELDSEGFKLFRAAEEVLGKLDYSHFAYEDNIGRFEEANGHMLLPYLMVQYAYKLGEANTQYERWAVVAPCYEECVDLTIDASTPEYQEFAEKMYKQVLSKLGILV